MTGRAEGISKALGGRKFGRDWVARCPAHRDRRPSLSVRDAGDTVLVYCHAGCEQNAVIEALRRRGLWPERGTRVMLRSTIARPAQDMPNREDAARRARALEIWRTALPINGTLAQSYLQQRGLLLPLPDSLRFHPALRHTTGVWPALVALVTHGVHGEPVAIHRTFLARDGAGKAPVNPQRMMLGRCSGGVVRLGNPAGPLMVGEGIETCLAGMAGSGHAAWAALSAAGLQTLDLPQDVRDVIVLADGDETGETAARECARRWKREGRRVRIAWPPPGLDFNDMLLNRRRDAQEVT